MNGELRWVRRFGKLVPVAVYELDADDCEGVAGSLSQSDRWADDLIEDAAELRDLAADSEE